MATTLHGVWRALWRTRRDRALSSLAILTLALGIGANTAIFSIVDTVLLRPLPYPEPERLVQVWNTYPLGDLPRASVSVPDYFDRREGVDAFAESALYHYRSFNLAEEEAPERLIAVRTTATLFPLLEAEAALGRVFTRDEDLPGRDRVAVLSHDLWRRSFGGDRGVVGRDVRLHGAPYRVVGVMPPSFAFPHADVDVWVPFAPTPAQRSDDERGREYSQMIARLAPDATAELAQEQIDAIHRRNLERFPEARGFWERSGFGGLVVPLHEERFGHLRPMLLLLQGVVLVVLLIACVNVANLLLARLSGRRRELAVRTALGADGWQIARQLLAESLVLAGLGGVLGVALAWLSVPLLSALDLDLLDTVAAAGMTVGLDVRVLVFALGLTLLTGLLFGLAPVLSLRRSDPNRSLREEGHGSAGGRRARRVRQVLVVAQVAMALVLLAAAGLLLRTLALLQEEDPGFRPDVLTARVTLPESEYGEPERIERFFDRALERMRAIPGVESAGLVSDAPFSGSSSSGSYEVVGYRSGPDEADPHALIRVVDEGYFRTMGIALLRGRTFDSGDTADSEPVAVVDRRLVEKYFPGGDPLDGRLRRGGPDSPTFRIVGVVEPVKVHTLDEPVDKETIYVAFRQRPQRGMTFALRAARDPESLGEEIRRAVRAVDPGQPVHGIATMRGRVADSLSNRRVAVALVAGFGVLALVLAAIGLYGVLAFSTARREREIGTRMALGASARGILGLVVGEGMVLSAAGVAVGAAAALGLGRVIRSQLFGVTAWDPVSYSGASAILLAVAAVACWRPARRAAAVDPAEALRGE